MGELNKDPGEILESRRTLPIGYWKGAGLSLMLDILATILLAGMSTFELSKQDTEFGISQVFIAISLKKLGNHQIINETINKIILDYKNSLTDTNFSEVRYPGESVIKEREKNMQYGIPVNRGVWEKILTM